MATFKPLQTMLLEMSLAPCAITFVDILGVLRAIRSRGRNVTDFSTELLALLDSATLTTTASLYLQNALSHEAKTREREMMRAQTVIRSNSFGKHFRAHIGQVLRVELPVKHGVYWRFCGNPSEIEVERVLGENAKAGFEVFLVKSLRSGSHQPRFTHEKDHAQYSKASSENATPMEFYFDLWVNT